jgi:endonuclease G
MHPDFNRVAWAEMEGILRAYVERNNINLYVLTLPIIEESAKRIERGTHQLPIPSEFIKVVMDPEHGKGVAFKMPNRNLEEPISTFCYSIDDVESYASMDFFTNASNEDEIEKDFDLQDWFPDAAGEGVQPLLATSLPQGHINTSQAKLWMGSSKKINVCGTIVSSRFSGSGNYWMNFDKKFPDTVFSVYIRKEDFIHFDNIDINYLVNEKVCVEGKVTSMYGIPNMNIEKQEAVSVISP